MGYTYIVTFEVKNLERLTKLKEKLMETKFYCPIHENAWAVNTEKKASELRDELISLTTAEDRLFVIRSGTEAAWINSYGEKHTDWLKKYL